MFTGADAATERSPRGSRGSRRLRALLAALVGCLLAAATAAAPAPAQRPSSVPQELWRAYPLEQSPSRTAAAGRRSSGARPPAASRRGPQRPTVVVGATALGVLLIGGAAVLLWLRRWRPAPALRMPRSRPPKRPPPEPTARLVANPGATASRSAPGHTPAQHSLPARGPAPPAAETCWIVCWRGARHAMFYAVARDPEGHQHFIGESPTFTQPPTAPLVLDGAALEALDTLARQLAHGGWEAASSMGERGAAWHAHEFRRKAIPADRPDRQEDRDDHSRA